MKTHKDLEHEEHKMFCFPILTTEFLFYRLFRQYLLLLLTNQMANALFRVVAALGRNMIVANTFGSFVLLAVMVFGGFVLSRGKFFSWKKRFLPVRILVLCLQF